ncbi:14606_t:CDS:2, partial [Dentiscutata erythropus]
SSSEDDKKSSNTEQYLEKNYIIKKSPWAAGRPTPLVNQNDWKGLNVEEVKNLRTSKKGIQVLAFDKDNTLTAPYSNKLHEQFENAWKECQRQFGKENIIIISNSIGTDDDLEYRSAQKVENSLGVSVLRHKYKKPNGGTELITHFASLPPAKIAVIGDRLLTDILFGNMNGMFTIFTKQIITEKGDNKMAAMIRRFEYRILDYLKDRGVKPPPHPLH